MIGYFVRRILLIIPTFIGITLIAFVVMHFVPGGPIERQIMAYKMAMAQEGGGGEREVIHADDAGVQARGDHEVRGGHALRRVLEDGGGLLFAGTGQDDQEFFPAVTGHRVLGTQRFLDDAGQVHERIVTGSGTGTCQMDARTGLGRFREFRVSNYQLMMDLIDYCANHRIEEILQLPDVKERFAAPSATTPISVNAAYSPQANSIDITTATIAKPRTRTPRL